MRSQELRLSPPLAPDRPETTKGQSTNCGGICQRNPTITLKEILKQMKSWSHQYVLVHAILIGSLRYHRWRRHVARRLDIIHVANECLSMKVEGLAHESGDTVMIVSDSAQCNVVYDGSCTYPQTTTSERIDPQRLATTELS